MKEPLSVEELRIYEQRLHSMLASHSEVVERIERQALEPSGGARFQMDDESTEEVLLEQDLDVLAVEDDLGYETREALERIADDTYGQCEGCGEWIGRQRLTLLPYARLCSGCALGPRPGRLPRGAALDELCS